MIGDMEKWYMLTGYEPDLCWGFPALVQYDHAHQGLHRWVPVLGVDATVRCRVKRKQTALREEYYKYV